MYNNCTAKFKKYFKQRLRTRSSQKIVRDRMSGTCGLRTVEASRLAARHLETVRKLLKKTIKRTGKLWIPNSPTTPITAKPAGIRMGKGKGLVEYWVQRSGPGTNVLEFIGPTSQEALAVLKTLKSKLPAKSMVF